MRRFAPPPTSEIQDEWSRLPIERRREIVRRALEPLRLPEETGLADELRAEGLSDPLVRWIGDEAEGWQKRFLGEHLESMVAQALPKTKADRLNATLVAFIVLLVGLIWTGQELRALSAGTLPIGLIPAPLVLLFGWIAFRRSLVRLVKSLRGSKKGPPDP